ncbi:MAG: helix-turn-helix domain-containing protein [Planctomycetota bacterium]
MPNELFANGAARAMAPLWRHRTDAELESQFHNFRWPEGIKCLKCNKVQTRIYRDRKNQRLRYYCEKCRIWWNDFTGTILQGKRLSLRQFFIALHLFLVSHETCLEVARQTNLNRHTAETLLKAIKKEEHWARMLLNRLTGTADTGLAVLLTLNDVQSYLGLGRRTLYRLISSGALSASKIGGQWRFKPEDIQKYFTARLNRYGTVAVTESICFRPEVLDKYRKDKSKYYIEEEAYQGWVGSREDYNYMQKLLTILGKGARHTAPFGRIAFYDVHYRKVVTRDGHSAISISFRDYDKLPPEEYEYWSRFRIN